MKFSVYQVSRRGGRATNQDRMGYCYTRESALFALADGLGGHPRGDVAALLEEETRAKRVFFRDKRDLAVQLRRWNGRKLGRLGDKLMDMHRALMANNQSAELLLAQGLAEIARAASPRR